MKKILLTALIIILTAGYLSAQSTRFGVTGGATLSNMTAKEAGKKDRGKFKFGGTMGIVADFEMEMGSFQTGLNFVQKGMKDKYSDSVINVKIRTTLNYLELPLNLIIKIRTRAGNVLIGGGPSVAFGIFGRSVIIINGDKGEDNIKFGNHKGNNLEVIDLGMNALCGFELKNGVFISANYTHGIKSILFEGSSGEALYNRYFSFRVGYLLNNLFARKQK